METFYVDGKNGNDKTGNGKSNNPWKSLDHAETKVSAGDTVLIRSASYRSSVSLKVNNVTWKAEDGHQPVLDGGYNEGLFKGNQLPPPDNYVPGSAQGNMISVRGTGIVVDGLTIQNIAGVGIGVTGDRTTIRNCRIDFCYGGGLIINGGNSTVAGPLIENNTITRCSMKYYDAGASGAGQGNVQTTLNIVKAENAIIRHNIVAFSYGEGITMGGGTLNGLIEGNVVHTCNHVHIYINRGRDCVVRNNFVYHLYTKEHLGRGQDAPSGIAIGDESASDRYPHSRGSVIYNNVVVGMGKNISVRNNSHNYDTQLDNSYIGYNTLVGLRMTRVNVDIDQNVQGRPHQPSFFENNVVYHSGPGSISKGSSLGKVTCRNNLWSEQPGPGLRGQDDRLGDPRLANPEANITGTSPGATNADPFNYRLTKSSSLAIGRASSGSGNGGFVPPKVERDFFNNNRDNAADIGGHEFSGESAQVSANYSIGPGQQQGAIPHTVDFVDRSTSDTRINEWAWDFGDGSRSTEQNPSHTFMAEGTYTVSLTVKNTDGKQDTIVKPNLIAATLESPEISSEDFRRFVLIDNATSDALAFGAQYPDLSCAILISDPFSMPIYRTIEDVIQKYVVSEETQLLWLDPILEPIGSEE